MPAILAAPTRWVLVLSSSASVDRDFSRYDAYLGDLPVLFLQDEGRKATATLQLSPQKTDIGQSEFEARPEYGDWFAQGDFSRGAGQRFFHRPGRDDAKYLHAEGFDISEPGVLRHVNDTGEADDVNLTDPASVAVFDGLPYVAQGDEVFEGTGTFPGTWTAEDPQAGEVAADVLDLTSNGDLLFAAIGVNGVHTRTTAGVWDHYQPDASTDLDTGDTRVVRWLKDRLMVIGAAGRSIYEVVGDSTPTAIETIPAGWEFTDMFEAGPFILATAVSPTSGLSRVHAYGLNSGASAIEKKSSTPMPKGTLIYSGAATQGRIFLGGGVLNKQNGKNSCLLEAVANETGELQTLLIAKEDDDDTADVAVRCFEVLADSIVFGWGRGNNSIHGRFVGLGRYFLARNAFSLTLESSVLTDKTVNDVVSYKDRLLFCTDAFGLEYEDLGTPKPSAYLITSIADWHRPGIKTWDLFELTHHALSVGDSIQVQYTKKSPDELDWQDTFTSETPGAQGAEARIEGIEARTFTLKITSTAGAGTGPEILEFAVRSVPSPLNTEWRLLRTVRVFAEDRKSKRAESVKQDPREIRSAIQDLAHTFVTVYEAGVTWTAYVEDIAEVEPGTPEVSETGGTSLREAYYMELRMVARRAA